MVVYQSVLHGLSGTFHDVRAKNLEQIVFGIRFLLLPKPRKTRSLNDEETKSETRIRRDIRSAASLMSSGNLWRSKSQQPEVKKVRTRSVIASSVIANRKAIGL